MVYNDPISYGNDVTPKMFAQLAALDTIVAMKESSGNTRRITDIRNEVGDRFAIFTGVDDLVLRAPSLASTAGSRGSGSRSPTRPAPMGSDARRQMGGGARSLPLVHAPPAPRRDTEARAVHRARDAGERSRQREVTCAAAPARGRGAPARARDHPRGNWRAAEARGGEARREAGPQTWEGRP